MDTPHPDTTDISMFPGTPRARTFWETACHQALPHDEEALDEEALREAGEMASGDVAVSVDAVYNPGQLPIREATARAILDRFPGLRDIAHRKLFVLSLVGQSLHTSFDRAGHRWTRVKIPAPLLSLMQTFGRGPKARVLKPVAFLEAHRAILPGFAWTGWERGHYPRQVERSGVPDDILAMIVDDLRVPVREAGPLVDFGSYLFSGEFSGVFGGAAFGGDKTGGFLTIADPSTGRAAERACRERERCRAEAAVAAKRSPWPLQQKLLALLNGAPGHVLSRTVRANAPAAIGVALKIADPERQLRTLASLREIQLAPDIVYAPSRRLRAPRVFATSVSVLGLPREVRKAIFAGRLELDLVNAQLAIAARVWGIDPLIDHLESEGSVWPLLIAAVAETHSLGYDEAKDALKTAVYSCVFGMSKRGLRRLLAATISAEAAAAFLAEPLIAALLVARDRALAEIDAAGGITDILGYHRALKAEPGSPKRKAECRSALAGAMQAVELKLLEPIIDEAIRVSSHKRPAFRIVGWLHDGLTISGSARGIERRLVRLVAEQAERLGVPTSLDATWLGTSGPDNGAAHLLEGRRRASRTRANRPGASGLSGQPDYNPLGVIKQTTLPGGPNGDCWLWQGPKDRDGYGRTSAGGRRTGAHRASWEAANERPVPPELVVRHSCHTPACVNPEHLLIGTPADNVADSIIAGRFQRGERNGRSVLRGGDAGEVRQMADRGIPKAAIARLYGVHPTTVRDIVKRKIWKHTESAEATAL